MQNVRYGTDAPDTAFRNGMADASRSGMALREFTDKNGRNWRAWDVTSATIHPATRSEDFMRDFLDGWLTFESLDGGAKCRLTPIPRGWESATDEQLEEWLHAAATVRGERTSGPHGRTAAEAIAAAEAAAHDEARRAAEPSGGDRQMAFARTFRYPGGRYWSVAEWAGSDHNDASSDGRSVLRFTSGRRSLDLASWPRDWQQYSDEELVSLLFRSFPRDRASENPTSFQRRASDGARA